MEDLAPMDFINNFQGFSKEKYSITKGSTNNARMRPTWMTVRCVAKLPYQYYRPYSYRSLDYIMTVNEWKQLISIIICRSSGGVFEQSGAL